MRPLAALQSFPFKNGVLKLPAAIYRFWTDFFFGRLKNRWKCQSSARFYTGLQSAGGVSLSVCGLNLVGFNNSAWFKCKHLHLLLAKMMMVSDDCLVECKIDDSDEDDGGEEQINTPPPPPEFASKSSTPAPKAPTPPGALTTPRAPTPPIAPAPPAAPPTPAATRPVSRDPRGINQHLKVLMFVLFIISLLCHNICPWVLKSRCHMHRHSPTRKLFFLTF